MMIMKKTMTTTCHVAQKHFPTCVLIQESEKKEGSLSDACPKNKTKQKTKN